ncbi:MAG: Ger(x)C family spore germination protein [Oscillospiraceae bacterium]|nr:Ger(x)C family spore germination protein [Oscillospiraceae bacterium]
MRRILCLAVSMLLLCGCMDTVQLNERAIVQAIGVDQRDGELLLSMQVFEPYGGAEAAGGKTSCRVVQVSGETMSEALQNAALKQGKEVFYGHNKLIVIGRGLAREGMEEVIRFFNTDRQSRPNVDMMMADGEAADIISAELGGSMLPVLTAQMMLENYKTSGGLIRARVRDLAETLENPSVDAFLPVVRLGGDDPENPMIEVSATAVLRQSSLAGELTPEETRGLLWLRGDVKRTQISLKGEDGVSLMAKESSLRIRPWVRDGQTFFSVYLRVQSTVEEPLGNRESVHLEEEFQRYGAAQSRQLEEEIRGTLQKLTRELAADPVGFADYLAKYEPEFWSGCKDRYRELLPGLQFEIQVESDIDRAGLA